MTFINRFIKALVELAIFMLVYPVFTPVVQSFLDSTNYPQAALLWGAWQTLPFAVIISVFVYLLVSAIYGERDTTQF